MDSGAFTRIANGHGHLNVETYAQLIRRWGQCGQLLGAVSQDYMCEPFILNITGLSVLDHQWLTLDRYDELLDCNLHTYIMPVLQGYSVAEYLQHVDLYGQRLQEGAWVGVGSVCKRNRRVQEIETIVHAIKSYRPDLRLHLFGLKITALRSLYVTQTIHSADSMAWSYGARVNGRNANDWHEALQFQEQIDTLHLRPTQLPLNEIK
jgi:hypothetical protein